MELVALGLTNQCHMLSPTMETNLNAPDVHCHHSFLEEDSSTARWLLDELVDQQLSSSLEMTEHLKIQLNPMVVDRHLPNHQRSVLADATIQIQHS